MEKQNSVLCTKALPTLIGSVVVAIASVTNVAQAQDEGGNELEILLNVSTTFTDNFYYEDSNERSVAGATLSPIVEYSRSTNAIDFGLTATADIAAYSYGRSDNFADVFGSAAVNFKLPARMVLGFTAAGKYGHDPFGTDRTEGQPSQNRTLDKWTNLSGTVALVGGQAESANLGYELKYTAQVREYQTNTPSTQFLDRQFDTGSATLLYNFSPKFSVLGQGILYELAYDQVRTGSVDRSAGGVVGMLGLKWAATAKTSGDIRFGKGKWQPKNSAINDFDSNFWQASLSWSPTRKMQFRATGGRKYLPTYRFDAVFIDQRNVSIEWAQLWTYRNSTKLTLGQTQSDFVGIAENHDYLSARLKYEYQMDREIRAFISYGYLDRDAQQNTLDFARNGANIGFEAKFN